MVKIKTQQNLGKFLQSAWMYINDIIVKYENKEYAKQKLNIIANLDKKEFQLITVQNLEDIFLPFHLDLLNNLYIESLDFSGKPFFMNNEYYAPALKNWVDDDTVLYFECTLLSLACWNDNFEVAKWLLEHGADPNVCSYKNLIYSSTRDSLLIGNLLNKLEKDIKLDQYPSMCDCIKFLIQHGAKLNGAHVPLSFVEELFFEGFDPHHKIIDEELSSLHSAIFYETINLQNNRYIPLKTEYFHISDNEPLIVFNKDFIDTQITNHFKFARMLLAYRHITSENKDAVMNKIELNEEDCFDNFNTIFDTLVDEEYEFRKSFLGNPEGLFLELIKRCKRPELWIKRIKDEIGISPAQQNKIIWQICSQTLSLLYNIMRGEKSEFAMNDLAKTSMFLVEKISTSEGKTDFVKIVCKLTAKILLDTVHKLHEGSDTLYESTKPLIDCLFEHPNVVSWLKKKEGKNILHVLALNCINANKFLQKIEKYTENNKDERLQNALRQPMNSSFTHETHTTPLYIATQQLEIDDTCRETVHLLEKIEKNLNTDKKLKIIH